MPLVLSWSCNTYAIAKDLKISLPITKWLVYIRARNRNVGTAGSKEMILL
jgi:hypothetical protein